MSRVFIDINKTTYNEAWGIYIHLSTESFYFAFTFAGVDIEFHIHNLRDIVYEGEPTLFEKFMKYNTSEESVKNAKED